MKLNMTKNLAFLAIGVIYLTNAAYAQNCNANMKALTPDSRFSIISNGSEVKDNMTGLVWQRCSLGQTWNGTTCIGEAKKYNWKDALVATKNIGDNYRLPNVRELRSIVEKKCSDLAINQIIFPNTRPDNYWTSSPASSSTYLYGFSYAYEFIYGDLKQNPTENLNFVRPVK